MVNEEKVRLMTRLAIYEEKNERTVLPLAGYYRSDYVSVQMLKSFFCGTIGFAVVLGCWILYGLEGLMQELFNMDLIQFGKSILVKYLAFIIIYMGIAYIVSNYRYAKGKKSIKKYVSMLKKVERMQEREETSELSREWEA